MLSVFPSFPPTARVSSSPPRRHMCLQHVASGARIPSAVGCSCIPLTTAASARRRACHRRSTPAGARLARFGRVVVSVPQSPWWKQGGSKSRGLPTVPFLITHPFPPLMPPHHQPVPLFRSPSSRARSLPLQSRPPLRGSSFGLPARNPATQPAGHDTFNKRWPTSGQLNLKHYSPPWQDRPTGCDNLCPTPRTGPQQTVRLCVVLASRTLTHRRAIGRSQLPALPAANSAATTRRQPRGRR
ncbi:uncharacterized protein B0H18DRAFT_582832 [Fomitopsis serialis]|uniref:uncharacterized protein n=1 Tax=Fomitopsis serialis TaxID=139415 RepID=UPI00200783E9|nr:uncharacterized protein B0H18DRAFT_582832 [Neoantrodia serialis]KAH9920779.1 hypothetical protein B0H18DRAFT_582832 [Neoantrodia serialis]